MRSEPGHAAATILEVFRGRPDGAYPVTGLTLDSAGGLYGTTQRGGTADYGTVFKLTPPAPGQAQWTETLLYRYVSVPGRNLPHVLFAPLIFDRSGALYTTSWIGGTPTLNEGTVFRIR